MIFATLQAAQARVRVTHPRAVRVPFSDHWMWKDGGAVVASARLVTDGYLLSFGGPDHQTRPGWLREGMWAGRPCFVVGGGPSLEGFDFETLRGRRVITVNKSYQSAPWAALRVTADARFVRWDREAGGEFEAGPAVFIGMGTTPTLPPKWRGAVARAPRWKGHGDAWGETLDDLAHWGHSGFAALNLAWVLGADPIYLLGFDLQGSDGGQQWHHEPYPVVQDESVYDRFARGYEWAAANIPGLIDRVRVFRPRRPLPFLSVEEIPPPPTKREPILLHGCHGLGDQFYQRPVVKALAKERDVFLYTPWPEVYADLGVRVINPDSALRTQAKHAVRVSPKVWSDPPPGVPVSRVSYGPRDFRRGLTPTRAMAEKLGVKPVSAPIATKAHRRSWIGLVHPATVRREWKCPARNPEPGALQEGIDAGRDALLPVSWISVADLEHGEETLAEQSLAGVSVEFHRGEVGPEGLMELVRRADVILTPPGFLLPMALALGAGPRTVVVFGGHAPPEVLEEPLLGEPFRAVAPDPFCDCYQNGHDCAKGLPPGAVANAVHEVLGGVECPRSS